MTITDNFQPNGDEGSTPYMRVLERVLSVYEIVSIGMSEVMAFIRRNDTGDIVVAGSTA